jgi:hypothetical protein
MPSVRATSRPPLGAGRWLLLLAVIVVAMPTSAKVSKRVCKESCAGLVAQECAALRKKKLKRCRAGIWRQCRRETLDCAAATTTTTLAIGPGCPATFVVSDPYPGGTDQTVAIADLNDDGRRDVVLGANPTVSVRLGNGDGTLGALAGYEAGGDVRGVAVADVTGDGKPDVVASNFMSDPPSPGPSTVVNVSVLPNLGGGVLGEPVPYFVGTREPHDVVVADFDGDTMLDIVVATHPSVVLFLNDGNGSFAGAGEYPAGTTGRGLAVADLNGDGTNDLAATTGGLASAPGAVLVMLGNGKGDFGVPTPYEVGRFPYAIFAGDLNGDGKIDLATANNNSADMSILLGNGNGTFAPHVDYDAGGLPTSLAGGDFDADGRLDLVISAGPSGTVGRFLNLGGGTFADVAGTFTQGSAALAAGDLDGDGKADVVSATATALRVLLSRCP